MQTLNRLDCSPPLGGLAFKNIMIYKSSFQTWNEKEENGLVVFINSKNQIYIGTGSIETEHVKGGVVTICDGYTILSKEDAIALSKELKKLVKEL